MASWRLFREYALGNFRDLLVEVAKDPAMVVWLDGSHEHKTRPQENFAREIMELFTMGVGFYTESDVYAGARVFSGWNLERVGRRRRERLLPFRLQRRTARDQPPRNSASRSIRTAAGRFPRGRRPHGMQDGLDLIDALARHPETGRRLARKLYGYLRERDRPAQTSS